MIGTFTIVLICGFSINLLTLLTLLTLLALVLAIGLVVDDAIIMVEADCLSLSIQICGSTSRRPWWRSIAAGPALLGLKMSDVGSARGRCWAADM